tara:strand:+ start:675 stop:875 length:201 start_codon:yes stop_codon:yes gene_type:complete
MKMSGISTDMEKIKDILNGPFVSESEDGVNYRILNNDGDAVAWITGNLISGLILTLLNGICEEESK